MAVYRSKPRRPAWLYPVGSILETRDGRRYVVDEVETRVYDEDGIVGREEDYVYSTWRRYWRGIA